LTKEVFRDKVSTINKEGFVDTVLLFLEEIVVVKTYKGLVRMSRGQEPVSVQSRWNTDLFALYNAFRTEEGHERLTHVVPFSPNGSIVRFLAVYGQTALYESVGMATIIVRPNGPGTSSIGIVEDVYVLPEHRGRGYRTHLMNAVIEEGWKMNLARLELTSNPNKPGRDAAMRIYTKLGFKLEDPLHGGTNLYRYTL
jgi:GNAT superfamily N-acetyltransferase